MSVVTTLRTPEGIMHFLQHYAAGNGTCRRRNVAAALFESVTGYASDVSINQRPSPLNEARCVDNGCPRGIKSIEELPIETSYDSTDFCTYVHAEAVTLMKWDQSRYPFNYCDMYVTEDPCWNCSIMIAYARPRALFLPMAKTANILRDAKRVRMLRNVNIIGVQT